MHVCCISWISATKLTTVHSNQLKNANLYLPLSLSLPLSLHLHLSLSLSHSVCVLLLLSLLLFFGSGFLLVINIFMALTELLSCLLPQLLWSRKQRLNIGSYIKNDWEISCSKSLKHNNKYMTFRNLLNKHTHICVYFMRILDIYINFLRICWCKKPLANSQ